MTQAYRLSLSRRKIPIVVCEDAHGLVKFLPWDFASSMVLRLRLRLQGFQTSPRMLKAWKEFKREYSPPPSVPKDALLVDVGARDGDSAIYFWSLGYTRMRLVEPDPETWGRLVHNADELSRRGCDVEVFLEPFHLEHLKGAAFVKLDCEGCEGSVDFSSLHVPWVAEFHTSNQPDAAGVFPYTESLGVRRGGACT